jgi:pimeloyl-ACP methyl ester carboxylesterase
MLNKISHSNKNISYRVVGSGSPVILVHGFGETGDVWHHQVDFLQHKCKLIVPDLPGSGESEMIPDMSMEGMAAAIKAILDIEVIDQPVIMIGHSMGGYIALAFAEKYPLSLSGLGLFHSTAFADSEEKKAVRRKGIAFIRENGAFEFLKTATPNLFSPISKTENQPLINSFLQSLNNFSAQSLVSYYEAMMARPDRTHVLTNSKIPVLFIMGKYDTAVPMDDTLKLCSLPEKAYIHSLSNSGHMGMLEEADLSNEMLDHFIRSIRVF